MQKEKDATALVVYKVSSKFNDSNTLEKIWKETKTDWGRTYATDADIKSSYAGNGKVIQNGYNNIFIVHPRQDLYFMHMKSLDDVITENAIWHKKDKMTYYEKLSNRKKFVIDRVAFEDSGYSGVYSDYLMTTSLGKKYTINSVIKFHIKRNFKIENMMKIGDLVEIRPTSDFEIIPDSDYSGTYVMTKTEMFFSRNHDSGRADNYDGVASITAGRSVHTKK